MLAHHLILALALAHGRAATEGSTDHGVCSPGDAADPMECGGISLLQTSHRIQTVSLASPHSVQGGAKEEDGARSEQQVAALQRRVDSSSSLGTNRSSAFSGIPAGYEVCMAGTCQTGDGMTWSQESCVNEADRFPPGSEYKKIGNSLKVTIYMESSCEEYSTYTAVLDCGTSDWVSQTISWPVQSFKLEMCNSDGSVDYGGETGVQTTTTSTTKRVWAAA